MNRIKTILLTLAIIIAGASATRADELSDLVAAVAASVDSIRMAQDIKTSSFGGKRRYKPNPIKNDVSVDLLDGIIKSMNRQVLQERRRYDGEYEEYLFNEYSRPTLGRADFFRPVAGIITSRFGWRPQFHRMHHGVDLSLNIGDTVRAAVSGTVERISFDPDGYGHYVIMSHPDGMETLYGHLQYALVSQGQFVYSGQPLAIGGNTGNSTGPHLHFEARLDGIAVDPTLLFDFYGAGRYMYQFDDNSSSSVAAVPKTPTYTHQSKSLKREETYIVRYGDTLESVARQAGISVMRLCQLNMLNTSDPLTVGRMLKLK